MSVGNTTPRIALGTWAWGNDGTFGDTYTAKKLRPVFDAAMDNGLNVFDTAYAYGMGTSERILGQVMRGRNRDEVIISDKFTPQCDDGSREPMKHLFDIETRLLGVDTIDIYWIHNPMNVEKYTPMLIPLAKAGKIRSIGVSNHNMKEILRAEEILSKEGLHISAIQNHYSLLYRSSEDAGILDYCKEHGITFYSYMTLEQGALSGKYDTAHPLPKGSDRARVYNPMLSEIEKLNRVTKEIADAHSVSQAAVPVAWAIRKGTVPILGVTSVSQVLDAVTASNLVLTDEEAQRLEKAASETKVNTRGYWEHAMI